MGHTYGYIMEPSEIIMVYQITSGQHGKYNYDCISSSRRLNSQSR